MNILPLMVLTYVFSGHTGKPTKYTYRYIDTFQLELLLDRLHDAVNSLENVNRLNRMIYESSEKGKGVEQLRESLEVINGIVTDDKAHTQFATVSNALGVVSQLGGLQGVAEALSPMLKALSNSENSSLGQ